MADKVAYIEIGCMDRPMAMHLANAEFDIAVYDIDAEKMKSFVTAHGKGGDESGRSELTTTKFQRDAVNR